MLTRTLIVGVGCHSVGRTDLVLPDGLPSASLLLAPLITPLVQSSAYSHVLTNRILNVLRPKGTTAM